MTHAALLGKAPSIRLAAIAAATLLAAALLLACIAGSASAASLAARDGKIHACYKAKGKAKGTLRVVRSAKARCPRGWKKTAWNASGAPGAAGENGGNGAGEPGSAGGNGANGMAGTNAKVSSLESQVTELLTKLKSLESILAGITNTQLKEAIGNVPVIATLCTEAKKLNEQSNGLGTALGALGALLDPLTGGALPTIPTALPAFTCPAP
jgi:hypothetical protein